MAFCLFAQFGLAVASNQLPALKAMAGLAAPPMALLRESALKGSEKFLNFL
jgi:hypothetical protein